MATLGATMLTLADHAKRLGPDNKIAPIVELLSQSNSMIEDMAFIEANGPTSHRTNIRTGLPTVYWRMINQGVASSKSTTAQVDEGMGMLEARSQVDADLAKLCNDLAAFRLSEAQPFVEAMSQEAAQTIVYGNGSTSPEEFTGLAARYSSLSAANAQNIINAGAVGSDNSSIWLVCWGEQTVHGIFPKGSQAGLVHEDLGLADAFDSDNNRFRAYMDRWQWKLGVSVKDWRYAVRIANLDISALGAKTSAADLIELMIKATHRIPNMKMGKPVFYCNRSVFQALDIQRRDDVQAGGGLTYKDVDGQPAYSFRGVPVKINDCLHELETVVS